MSIMRRAFPTPISTQAPLRESSASPLPSPLRQHFEPLFDADFSQVRIHADASSAQRADALHADAYAQGQHLHFGTGQWRPDTPSGRHLIAHELAHTLQQRPAVAAGASRSNATDLETDAEVAAQQVSLGRSAHIEPSGQTAVQRRPKSYDSQRDEGHSTVAENVKAFKALYVQWRSELTTIIEKHCGRVDTPHDYRFIFMLAQRMVEQDGPHARATGNNPYNVMGSGDAKEPTFHREKNIEKVNGVDTNVPADFANYTTEPVAHDAYLTLLERNWPSAYAAICSGGSIKDFVTGLFPGKGNFATASPDAYLTGVRLRARLVVGDLRRIYANYLKEYQAKVAAHPPASPAPDVAGEAELNQWAVTLLTEELKELDDLTDRIAGDQPVNRPMQAAAGVAGTSP
jgi:hypothetical protein